MSLSYTLRESFSGFSRTRISSAIAIVTIMLALLLLGVFAIVTVNASRFVDLLRDKVEMQAFLQEPVGRDDVAEIQSLIESVAGVEKTTFVSKDDAAKEFKQEYGEDVNAILNFNPLPPSFKVYLKNGYKTSAKAQSIYREIENIKGIDTIAYRKEVLEIIDEKASTAHTITLTLGAFIGLSAVFLVANTIRLAIESKKKLIRTMDLVGATAMFIRLPFLIEGVLQGFFGGGFAAGILYVIVEKGIAIISPEIGAFIHMEPMFYPVIVIAGMLLGLIGSSLSVARFIRPAQTA